MSWRLESRRPVQWAGGEAAGGETQQWVAGTAGRPATPHPLSQTPQAHTHQQKATVPKVLRRWYSSRPAQNWARPPKKKPKDTASCEVPGFSVSCVLEPCSSAVVSAKPYRPRGAAGGGRGEEGGGKERRQSGGDGGEAGWQKAGARPTLEGGAARSARALERSWLGSSVRPAGDKVCVMGSHARPASPTGKSVHGEVCAVPAGCT